MKSSLNSSLPSSDNSNSSSSFVAKFANSMFSFFGLSDLSSVISEVQSLKRVSLKMLFENAAITRRNFYCQTGKVNFDGKLLAELGGFGKVNRLAVILIQEDENQMIIGIPQTEKSTGRVEAEMEYLDCWKVSDKIKACHIVQHGNQQQELHNSTEPPPSEASLACL